MKRTFAGWLTRAVVSLSSGLMLLASQGAIADDSIVRIESVNIGGFSIRHANFRGRIDPVASPAQDGQFRIVAGLANASAVSIESVNFPGRFLRHRNGEIWLDANDNSAIFKSDATWWQRAGNADSGGVSFESYNFPGQFIRHRDSLLYREAINTALDRKDSSFRIKNTVAYVMAGFAETPDHVGDNYGLHLAYSYDALNWVPLNQNNAVVSVTVPNIPGLRDPFIIRKNDNRFAIVATKADWGATVPSILVFDTPDLISYTQREVRLSNTEPTHAWAPEAYWDPDRNLYGIIWSQDIGGRNRLMVNYTSDFVNVGAAQTFFDPGVAVIDGDVHRYGGTTYMYYKDETDHYRIKGTRSADLTPNSWTIYTGPIQHGTKDAEGPNVIRKINENRWLMYTDSYQPNGVIYAFETNNIAGGVWTEVDRHNYVPPQNIKHTTIVEVSQGELDRLIQRWGNPDARRLKSWNFPFSWVRHQDFQAKLTEEPFDPYSDSQWRVVPGLADPNAVSFESKSKPGFYLRHYNYLLRIDQSDGSSTFRADATFYQVPGLANGGWSSFRSYNVTNYYMRHQDGLLRISPISSDLDRQDATFQITY